MMANLIAIGIFLSHELVAHFSLPAPVGGSSSSSKWGETQNVQPRTPKTWMVLQIEPQIKYKMFIC
jgi:hypothetical protein